MSRQRTQTREAPIQFRLGEPVSSWLSDFAERQSLSKNDVAKRLVILSRNGLDVRYFEGISMLADELGGFGGVEQACALVYSAIRSEEERCTASGTLINQAKRHALILNTIESNIYLRRLARLEEAEREKAEEERQKVKVYLTGY